MKRLLQVLIVASIVLIYGDVNAKDYPKPIQKRIDKAIKSTFGTEDVSFIDLSEVSYDITRFPGIEKVSVSKLMNEGAEIGLAGFASSKGKNDLFDYLVLFDKSMTIKKVVILVYRSSYGGEIMAKYWLKQFEGKYNGEQLEFNKDIDSISGATITAPSITAGIKSLSLLMVHLKETGKL
ncbi:FMN-binding protein [Marinifilum flexuosum]|uniref:FMN-binding protein n=1 Tax=Marinifilum flexuosum TaxID=1117708 RepID=A0A419X994_9BACT|nr:FMN-binding protein [Marinifilum flexuosum]RKE04216.1 FMN-binding protein [Marinifilum flexuosum]